MADDRDPELDLTTLYDFIDLYHELAVDTADSETSREEAVAELDAWLAERVRTPQMRTMISMLGLVAGYLQAEVADRADRCVRKRMPSDLRVN